MGKSTPILAYNELLPFVTCANWACFAVLAMRALKESLRVPDRMGWNGDPCAPTNWDAWEGVTCYPKKGESSLVISQM